MVGDYSVANILATYINGEYESNRAKKMGKGCSKSRLDRLRTLNDISERQRKKLSNAAFSEFCEEHSNPIDMIFNLYEDRLWYWKFLSQFFERAALVIIVTFWGGEEGTAMTGLILSSCLIGTMMMASWWSEPFIDPEQDRIDKVRMDAGFGRQSAQHKKKLTQHTHSPIAYRRLRGQPTSSTL
jgi:hypothetical protein